MVNQSEISHFIDDQGLEAVVEDGQLVLLLVRKTSLKL